MSGELTLTNSCRQHENLIGGVEIWLIRRHGFPLWTDYYRSLFPTTLEQEKSSQISLTA